MIVVLDTNALLVCIGKNSPFHILWRSLLEGKYQIALSTEIFLEYIEVIDRHMERQAALSTFQALRLSPDVILVEPHYKWRLIHNDGDDDKFVDCALTANADYLITDDKHFNVLRSIEFPDLKVMSLNTFLKLAVHMESNQ